jgi:S1-C subfamily serine protease/regulation of enolase protein 1 (concanavalin A-like superfamily)
MAKVVSCPACQGRMGVPEDFRGGRLQCPTCRHAFAVPEPAEAPRPAAATNKITCPSCRATKSVPATFAGGQLRCPTCGHQFTWTPPGAPRSAPAAPAPRPAVARPAPPSSPLADILDDADVGEPVPTLPSGPPRSARGPAPASSGGNLALWIGVGGAGLVALGLLAVLALRPGGPPPEPAAAKPDPQPLIGPAVADLAKPASPEPRRAETPEKAVVAPPQNQPPPGAPSNPAPRAYAQIIKDLEEATVYIKQSVNGKLLSTGTAYVIESSPGGQVLLATNKHVAVVDPDEVPEGLAPGGARITTEAVFRSGQGARVEQTVPVTLLAADMSKELGYDIAFLAADGVRNPPRPIDLEQIANPTRGMKYIGAGFPLGGMLSRIAESSSNPSVTITGGRVASLPMDDLGSLSVIQIDGSLQGGNSGGPLVEEETGKLIGMAVAKVSSVDTIGFAVPAAEVRRALHGRLGAIDLTRNPSQPTVADVTIRAQMVDPRARVARAQVLMAPINAVGTFGPNPDGSWPPLPNARSADLTIEPNRSYAAGRVQADLPSNDPAGRAVYVQTAHVDTAGRLVHGRPRKVILPEKDGRLRTDGGIAKMMETLGRKSMAKLGELVDPDQDCHMSKDLDAGRVTINVAGKLHTLSPEVTKSGKPLNNAPRTLTKVKGDFAAIVKVVGEFDPGATAPSTPQGKKITFTYQGAGILLYQDPKNHIRIERACRVDNLAIKHQLLVEVVKNGRYAMDPIYLNLPIEEDMTIIMIRRKGRMRFLFSPDGSTLLVFRELVFDYPDEVEVGLSASNVSTKPLEATFEEFTLIDDTARIDEELQADEQ